MLFNRHFLFQKQVFNWKGFFYEIIGIWNKSFYHEPAYLLEDLAAKGNIGEGVEEVGDHLADQRKENQEAQIIGQAETQDKSKNDGPEVETSKDDPSLMGHILELLLRSSQKAWAK